MLSNKLCLRALVPQRLGCAQSSRAISYAKPNSVASTYVEIKKYLQTIRNNSKKLQVPLKVELNKSNLYLALQNVWKPVCVGGTISSTDLDNLVKRVTLDEILEIDSESVPKFRFTDCSVSLMNKFWVDQERASHIASICNFQKIGAKYSLLDIAVYNSSHTNDDCLELYPRRDGQSGTLLVILNSEYTGGELVVMHRGGSRKTVSGSGNWIAISDDCYLSMNCVTSGTLKLLLFNLYNEDCVAACDPPVVPNDSDKNSSDGDTDDDSENDTSDNDEPNSDEDNEEPAQLTPWLINHSVQSAEWLLRDADMEEDVQHSVREEVRSELKKGSNIVIALDNVYSECQTSPAFLKDGDRALYDILHKEFDVDIVAATVRNDWKTYRAALFSPEIVRRTLAARDDEGGACKSTLILPNQLRADHILDQTSDTVYVVSGLRVCNKK